MSRGPIWSGPPSVGSLICGSFGIKVIRREEGVRGFGSSLVLSDLDDDEGLPQLMVTKISQRLVDLELHIAVVMWQVSS